MIRCTKCLKEKPDEEFSRDRRRETGRNAACKECDKSRLRVARSNKRHKAAWEEFKRTRNSPSARYKRVGKPDDPCVYCGRASGTRDHVPPRCFRSAWHEGFIYSACGECNSALSGKPLMTLSERKAYLIERYERAYDGVLAVPDWSETDLSEMHEDTAAEIRQWTRVKRGIQEVLKSLKR